MRVTFYHYYTFRLGRGIETLIISLANELSEKGHEITILSGSREIETLVKVNPKVKVLSAPKFKYFEHFLTVPFFALKLIQLKTDYTVIFFADFGEQYTLPIVNFFKKNKLVVYLCYPFSSVPHRYKNFYKKSIKINIDKVLADANWIAIGAEHVFDKKISTVPVGTDPDRFFPSSQNKKDMREKLGIKEDSFVLLNVSALEHKKGIWRVIEALVNLKDPQIIYVILGKGIDEENLRKMVIKHNLENQVLFLGTTAELELFYQLSDVFIMVPDLEGNSIASHEAMSSSLPLIVSNTGGFPEAVPFNGAIFVNPDNSQEIVSAIRQLKNDKNLRVEMGIINRNHIIDNYSWKAISEIFIKAIE